MISVGLSPVPFGARSRILTHSEFQLFDASNNPVFGHCSVRIPQDFARQQPSELRRFHSTRAVVP